jgi:hypothetical protein
LVKRTYKKVGVVFVDHFFKPLTEFILPPVPVFFPPRAIRLHHLPIRAHHRMAVTANVATPEIVSKFKRYLLQ